MKKPNPPDRSLQKLENTAFWKLESKRKLAKYLGLPSVAELVALASAGNSNFRCYLDKKVGRYIETPKPLLRSVQRRIHKLLCKAGPPDFLHSAFPGRSAITNAKAHMATSRLIKLDIRKFYPSSDGRKVFQFFYERLHCSSDVSTILWQLCTIREHQTEKNWRTHIPTGGVTSPILSYYAYMAMFEELASLALDSSLTFSVLADDITFSGQGANKAIRVSAEAIIRAHGLTPNWKKGRVVDANSSQKYITGVHLTEGGYRIPRKQWTKESEINESVVAEKNPLMRAKLYQKQTGLLFAAGQIDEKIIPKARAVLARWRNDQPAWEAHQKISSRRRKGHGRGRSDNA